jgi:ATP-dependent RNA helicase RhlE
MQFNDLQLIEPLLRAVREEGYTVPTPIQAEAIGPVLAGRDLLACAQTGTGKTAAFALPMLQRLVAARPAGTPSGTQVGRRPIRALVLTPTRELAAQIGESFSAYGRHLPIRNTVIFGGVGQSGQERALAASPEVLVATPGRLLDLADQRKVSFRDLEIFVLDEADRMLDMGFIHDVRRVIALLPQRRQTLFFSATMPPDIVDLSSRILVDPARVAVTPIASTAERIDQRVYHVQKGDKRALLEHVLQDASITRVLVFTRTKHGANRVAEGLVRTGITAEAIHGNKSQNARERALAGFKGGTTRVLVATDIAARGLDIDAVSHVINFDLPEVPESYVHRIGRTARAGASGIAFSFCDAEERPLLTAIERLIRKRIPVVEVAASVLRAIAPPPVMDRRDLPQGGRPPGRGPAPRPHAQQHGHQGRDAQRAPMPPPARPAGGGAAATQPAAPQGNAQGNGQGGQGQQGQGHGRRFAARPTRRYASS